MNNPDTYDDNVARLGEMHPALFEGRMPDYSHLPAGWFDLVDRLCSDIEAVLGPELSPLAEVKQIKEKLGTLRFYIRLEGRSDLPVDIMASNGLLSFDVAPEMEEPEWPELAAARERIRELVDAACDASDNLCHKCGKAGELRRTGWIQVLCEEHYTPAHRQEAEIRAARAAKRR